MHQSAFAGDIAGFLRSHVPICSERVTWQHGKIELELTTYVTHTSPPDAVTTSGHCIVLSHSSVLMMHNPGGAHILPGGRREPGESTRSATVRELVEETGLRIEPERQLGMRVFRHLTPMPVVYAYPYPVFVNIVYLARAPRESQVSVNDTYEFAGEFVAIDDARIRRLPIHQQMLLNAALRKEEE